MICVLSLLFQVECEEYGGVCSVSKGGSLGVDRGARPRDGSIVRTWADLSLKGECAKSGVGHGAVRSGTLSYGGGARPREKTVSVEKAWVELMDEEQKMYIV